MSSENRKKLEISEAEFQAAVNTVIIERLIEKGLDLSQIDKFEEKAKENVMVVIHENGNASLLTEWQYVLHKAGMVAIKNKLEI